MLHSSLHLLHAPPTLQQPQNTKRHSWAMPKPVATACQPCFNTSTLHTKGRRALIHEVYLLYVAEWVTHWQEQPELPGKQERRDLITRLQDEWRFAKYVAIYITNAEASAANKFCAISQRMLQQVVTFLDQRVDMEKTRIAESMNQKDDDDDDDCDSIVVSSEEDDMGQGMDRQSQFQLYRNLKTLIQEAQERSRWALNFSLQLCTDLEITASYRVMVTPEKLLKQLQATEHVLLETNLQQGLLMFVRRETADNVDYVQLLLNVTCGRSWEESPEAAGKTGYLVMYKPTIDINVAKSMWEGHTVPVVPNTDAHIALATIEVENLQLAVVHSSQLQAQRKDFGKRLHSEFLSVIEEKCSCHSLIAGALSKMKKKALKIRVIVSKWLQEVEKQLLPNGSADGGSELATMHLSFRDTVLHAYNFAFEFDRELVKLMDCAKRPDLARGMRQTAMQWMRYVMANHEVGKGTRPQWAYSGLKYLELVTHPSYTFWFTAEEFDELKSVMNKGIEHIYGELDKSKQSSVEYITSKSVPAGDNELKPEFDNQKSSHSDPPTRVSLNLDLGVPGEDGGVGDGTGGSARGAFGANLPYALSRVDCADRRVDKIRRACAATDEERQNKLLADKFIGHETNRENYEPEHQLNFHKKVSFRWQRLNRKIGKGASSDVYTAQNLDTSQVMAVKVINTEKIKRNPAVLQTIVDEITNFEGIKHRNLVRYFGVEVSTDELFIFMEYCNEGTLEDSVRNHGSLEEHLTRVYTLHILNAVHELHRRQIIHRDIKPANIFFASDEENRKIVLKLGDFGCSIRLQQQSDTVTTTQMGGAQGFIGTPPYMAPEVLVSSSYGKPADIWSVGCCVLEMVTGVRPHNNLEAQTIIYVVGTRGMSIPENLPAPTKDFLRKCLAHRAADRLTVHQLLDDEYVRIKPDTMMLGDEDSYAMSSVSRAYSSSNSGGSGGSGSVQIQGVL